MKCLNTNLPRVKALLEVIPRETELAHIIEQLGEDVPDEVIIEYYNKNVNSIKLDTDKIFLQTSLSYLKKQLKIHSKEVSFLQRNMILKRLGSYNARNGTNHSINFTKVGEADKYTYEITERWNNNHPSQGKLFQLETSQESPDDAINREIETILAKYGITVDRVNKVLYNNKSVVALADIANKIIKVAKGLENRETLPEEAGHFIMELLGRDNPLFNKIVELSKQSKLYSEIFDEYFSLYQDETEVAIEAAGKLLGRALTNELSKGNETDSFWSKLLKTAELIWNKIKSLFKSFPEKQLDELLDYAIKGFINEDLDVENISSEALSKAQISTDDLDKIVKNMKSLLKQKIAIYNKKVVSSEDRSSFSIRMQAAYDELEKLEGMDAIVSFIKSAIEDLKQVERRLDKKLDPNESWTISELEDLYQYIASYEILKTFTEKYSSDPEVVKLQQTIRTNIFNIVDRVKGVYQSEGVELLVDYYYSFIPKAAGLNKDDLRQFFLSRIGDIPALRRWVSSAGEFSDPIIGLATKVLRYQKQFVITGLGNYKKEIADMISKYENLLGRSGNDLWDFMFQRDKDGKKTGRWVEELSAEFWSDRYELQKELENFEGNDLEERAKIIKKYFYKEDFANEESFAQLIYGSTGYILQNFKRYNYERYLDKRYAALSMTEKQFLSEYIVLKQRLNQLLHNGANLRNLLPQVEQDFIASVWNSPNKARVIKEHLSLVEKDTDKKVKTLFKQDGSEAKFIPVNYVHKLADTTKIESDLGASTIMFAEMAVNNILMHQIEDQMIMTLNLLGMREVTPTRFGKPLEAAVKGIEVPKIKGKDTALYNAFKDFLDANLFGETQKEEYIGKVNIAKGANMLNAYTAIKGLVLNVFAATSNVTLGRLSRLVEGVAGEYFTVKDWYYGNKIFFTHIGDMLSELKERYPVTKMGLFVESLNLTQGHEDAIREAKGKYSKSWILRNLKFSHVFFLNNLGEIMLQLSTAFAFGRNFQTDSGLIVNMWEEASVRNGKLVWSNKVTPKDVRRYIDELQGLNQSLDGIYNQVDKAAAQQYAIGRLAFLFRRFMVPAFDKRWKNYDKPEFNFKRNRWEEGTYISLFRFLQGLTEELKISGIHRNIFSNAWNQDHMKDFRKAGVKKASMELLTLLAIAVATALMDGGIDDDDEPVLAFTFYQLNRLYVELGAFAPVIGVSEFFKLAKSPAAGINTLQDITRLAFDIFHPFDEYQGGKHSGDLKMYWHTINMIPIVNQIEKVKHIDDQTKAIQALF